MGQRRTAQQKRREKVTEKAARPAKGTLFIIGGREDKKDERAILSEIARRVDSGKLIIATLATEYADKSWELYKRIFTSLGVQQIGHLSIERRDEETEDANLELIEGAKAIFFTGGDQLKFITKLGGTRLSEEIEQIFLRGGIIAGTSAGATAMGEMMLIPELSNHLHTVRDAFQMVPGLGMIKNVIIDQHFSERGRIRRLLGAVAQNPRMIGIGIDEDTAVVVSKEESFRVIGSGAVYVADGRGLTHTNISQNSLDRAMSVFNIRLHILSGNDSYDLKAHQPISDDLDSATLKKA
ncbi:MAG TPA: cyanophycinase [Blastocatellia bacterium]|jgi:cyanophycinase